MADAARILPRQEPLAGRSAVSIGLVDPMTRLAFRGSAEAAELCGTAFGCALPREACRAESVERRHGTLARAALWLGPDEWLLLGAEEDPAPIVAAIAAGLGGMPHSLVDISHRQAGFDLKGANVEMLLAAGCPLDLEVRAFPIGMATRTILAKAEITLWRRGPQWFRLEVNRSFAPYLRDFLRAAEAGAF